MPPRVRAAVGGGGLAREARASLWSRNPSGTSGATGWTWGGPAVRDAALVGGQAQWHGMMQGGRE
eukprot:7015535-Prymnesium_polylepis.1